MSRKILCLALSFTLLVSVMSIMASGVDYSTAGDTARFDSQTFQNIQNTFTEDFDWIVKPVEYYTYDQMIKDIDALVAKYPDKVQKRIIGYSELGREIPALVIGPDNAESKAMFKGGAHAREDQNPMLAMKQVEFYLYNWNNTINGEKVSDLVKRCQFHFIPMNNPDGNMLVKYGYQSLDIIQDSAQKQARIEFLKPLLKEMNDIVAVNGSEADAGWKRPDDSEGNFWYWKANINGVDVHNNYWTPLMTKTLKTFYMTNKNYVAGPSYMNFQDDEPLSSSESKAVADYNDLIKFNIFIIYHQAGNVYQWLYGYKMDKQPELMQNWAQGISTRAADFAGQKLLTSYNSNIGLTGFNRELHPYAYSACLELGNQKYFADVAEYPQYSNDGCPLHVEQFTTDVVSKSGEKRYAIWTRMKFFPLYISQYLINNALVPPAGESVLPDAQPSVVKQTKPITDDMPTYPGAYENASKDPSAQVIPTPSKVLVNGQQTAFEAYNIGGANYFKLRDIAMALNGSERQFSVEFDSAKGAIIVNKEKVYAAIGGELTASAAAGAKTGKKTTTPIYLDGNPLILKGYNIDGANYFKLRDLGRKLSFAVSWDSASSTVAIDTKMTPIQSILGVAATPSDYENKGGSSTDPCPFVETVTDKPTISPSDIVAPGCKVQLFATKDLNFANEITDAAPVAITGRASGATTDYFAKITKPDGGLFYGRISLNRTIPTTDTTSTEITKMVVVFGLQFNRNVGTVNTPIVATRTALANRKADLKNDIKSVPGATVTFYTDSTFKTVMPTTAYYIDELNTQCIAWTKVTAADGKTVTYYKCQLRGQKYVG